MTASLERARLRRGLDAWLGGVVGGVVLGAEQAALADALPNLFGWHLVQVGAVGPVDLLATSRIGHRVIVDVDGTADAGVGLACVPEALPLAADSVDVILMPHVLEFCDDPHGALREVERVLVGEGHVVLVGFNPWSAFGLWRLCLAWRRELPWRGRFLGLGKLRDWLQLLGFEVRLVRRFVFRPPWGRLLRSRRFLFLEHLGGYFWPGLGGVYVVVARKRLVRPIPIEHPRERARRLVPAGVVEPLG